VVEFDEPMDHALALRMITVATGATGSAPVAGEAALGVGERVWRFVPDQSWQRGVHRLNVATIIEDLAGNNIGKAFDVDAFERVHRSVPAERVSVAFEVR
jgi:hypothetical protein